MTEAQRKDWIGFGVLAAIAFGTVALAAVLPARDAGPPSSSSLSDREPTCTEWTDGCIVCQRTDHGPACSTPGIACTRGPVQCLRRDGA